MTTRPVAEPAESAGRHVAGDGATGFVLGAALVAMVLVAGLIFTFSVAVMPNLDSADDVTFVVTMQRFNPNPVFPLCFTAALVFTVVSTVLLRRDRPALRWSVAGLVLYALVVAVTAGVHLPLNTDLDRAVDSLSTVDLAEVRDEFEGPWVVGNIVRAVFCTAAVAALARALFLHGRSTSGAGVGRPTWAPPAARFPAHSSPPADPSPSERSVRRPQT